MAGLTSTGLDIKRLTEVITSLNTRLITAYGNEINLDEDSLVSQLRDIFAIDIAELWALLESVHDAFNVDSAEGTQLDDLAALNKIVRLAAEKSTAKVVFKGNSTTIVPSSTVGSVTGTAQRFETTASNTIGLDTVYDVDLSVNTVNNGFLYSITINGNLFSFTSDGTATAIEIMAGLKIDIDAGSEPVTVTDNLDGTMNIVNADPADLSNTFTLAIVAELTVDKISNVIVMSSQDNGAILAPATKLVNIETPVFGIDTINNPEDATLGRLLETDTELRLRRDKNLASNGQATLDAIADQVALLDDVEKSVGFENDTMVVDSEGRPAKSFEIVVKLGDAEEIGQKIWDTKPAGIQSFGTVTQSVTDSNGNTQSVQFTRPTDIFVHVDVVYTTFSEETFPTDGETVMANAVLAFGQALDLGEDVIPQRFVGPIYDSVDGLSDVVVTMGTTTLAGDPTPALSNAVIPIGPKEEANFAVGRIAVAEAP